MLWLKDKDVAIMRAQNDPNTASTISKDDTSGTTA
jgi:hypothetical protein